MIVRLSSITLFFVSVRSFQMDDDASIYTRVKILLGISAMLVAAYIFDISFQTEKSMLHILDSVQCLLRHMQGTVSDSYISLFLGNQFNAYRNKCMLGEVSDNYTKFHVAFFFKKKGFYHLL